MTFENKWQIINFSEHHLYKWVNTYEILDATQLTKLQHTKRKDDGFKKVVSLFPSTRLKTFIIIALFSNLNCSEWWYVNFLDRSFFFLVCVFNFHKFFIIFHSQRNSFSTLFKLTQQPSFLWKIIKLPYWIYNYFAYESFGFSPCLSDD